MFAIVGGVTAVVVMVVVAEADTRNSSRAATWAAVGCDQDRFSAIGVVGWAKASANQVEQGCTRNSVNGFGWAGVPIGQKLFRRVIVPASTREQRKLCSRLAQACVGCG